jgi:uncharacterized protein (TIGR04168 family)
VDVDQNQSVSDCCSIVVLGDLHGHWDEQDERYYASLPCDLLLWTGDLADSPARQYAVAQSLARCGPRAFGLLGNHDGGSRPLAWCEGLGYRLLEWGLSFGHAGRVGHLRSILGDHDIGLARRELPHLGLTLIGLCPLQSGSGRLSFARTVRKVYGVSDPEPLLRRLIDEAESPRLLLLGHHGPAGLGTEPFAPFGRDWCPTGGDHGDPMFARLLDHAEQRGKEVVLAVAGHMHDACRGRTREALRYYQRTPVLNACRVPRLEQRDGQVWRWDYRAELTVGGTVRKLERTAWVVGKGIVSRQEVFLTASQEHAPVAPGVEPAVPNSGA